MTFPFATTLFLEDDPGHAMLIQRVLKEYSQEITHVTTLIAAQKHLKAHTPSLIITDLHVPDGADLFIIEKLIGLARGIPIIVLTSSTSLSTAVEAMKLGAKDYIVKNFGSDFRDVFGLAIQRTSHALKLEAERKRLQHEMAVLRIAIENSVDGLAIINADGSIAYANTSFLETVQRWGNQTTNIYNILSSHIARSNELENGIRDRLTGKISGGYWATEVTLLDDKSAAWRLELTSLFAPDAGLDDTSPQWSLTLKDVSDDKRREKFQRELLSTTTHDLKGPLGAIMLSSELITAKPDDHARVKELSLRISSSAQGAVNLIDELLSARRIQEGTFVLKPTEQNLVTILSDVVSEYQTIANAKSISLSSVSSSDTISCSFDKLGIMRVLGNLMSNAMKFTPKGGSVTLTASETDETVQIAVSDTGPGIEPGEAKKLFERFSRLSKHTTVAGTGLGLFVVKCIVTAHGGSLDVSSTVGVGTTFSFTLPKVPPVNQNGELISLDFVA